MCEVSVVEWALLRYNKKVFLTSFGTRGFSCIREVNMKVSYNKLWKLLVDKKMSKADLRKAADIAPNTMTKMRKDEEVSMNILLKIATYLDCDISDICEFVKED